MTELLDLLLGLLRAVAASQNRLPLVFGLGFGLFFWLLRLLLGLRLLRNQCPAYKAHVWRFALIRNEYVYTHGVQNMHACMPMYARMCVGMTCVCVCVCACKHVRVYGC